MKLKEFIAQFKKQQTETHRIEKTRYVCAKWVMVLPFVKSGKVVDCPYNLRDVKACLPIFRIQGDDTPTIHEVLLRHNKEDILKMAKQKNKHYKRTVNWDILEFY